MRLKFLHLEDSEADSELVVETLAGAGFDCELIRVETSLQFRNALLERRFDVILSDFTLPTFDGLTGLKEARRLAPYTPFVFFSGTLGEARAVQALRMGAADFVVKDDLVRLPLAVREALTNAQSAGDLRQSEEGFRLLFEKHPQPMWVYHRETLRFLEVNHAATEHYGYSRAEFLAMTISDIRPTSEARRLDAWLRTRGPQLLQSARTWRHRTKGGREIDVEITGHDLPFRGDPGTLVVAQDVTERSRLEEQLRQAQRVDAVGRLAGGVAHDFNNLLSVIGGYTDILLRALAAGDPSRARLVAIRRATDRAAGLTHQLLAFSRNQVLRPKVLDLNSVVASIEDMLRRLIGEDIRIMIVAHDNLGNVVADPGQLEQVLLNLAVNARDAMPRGGTLTIETENVTLDEAYAASHAGATPGRYVMLAFSDTGTGMDAETLSHIFEPFFTTKGVGEGTGLGLATVYGIVKQSEGHIWVYSEPDRGTIFRIYLPRVEAPAVDASAPVAEGPLPRGSETILVEDDEALRGVVVEILENQGYQVIPANAALAALELLERRAAPPHLLVTDLIMPGMNGPDLARSLVDRFPGLRVLFISGYTDAAIKQSLVEEGAPFLQKPFTLDAIVRRVRDVLDEVPDA
jgi:two-component system cell cycle sensor histidine kinase/response regulator CckA